jgi:hypothetical protein
LDIDNLTTCKRSGASTGRPEHGTEEVASMQYGLWRIEDDVTTTLISEHADIVSGIAEGKRIVEQDDFDFAYSLHTNDGCKLATFAEGRIGYREWASRCG